MISELPMPERGKLHELLPLHQAALRLDTFFSVNFLSQLVDELSQTYDISRKENKAVAEDATNVPVRITSSPYHFELRISPTVYATIDNASRSKFRIMSSAKPEEIERAHMSELIDQGYFTSETGGGNSYSYLTVRQHDFEKLHDNQAFERFVQIFAVTWNNFAIAEINELIRTQS